MNWAIENYGNSGKNFSRKLTTLKPTSVLLWAPAWQTAEANGHTWNDGVATASTITEAPGPAHGKGEPLGFIDGHVEYWSYQYQIYPKITVPGAPNGVDNEFYY
jgi:hypothetical protein